LIVLTYTWLMIHHTQAFAFRSFLHAPLPRFSLQRPMSLHTAERVIPLHTFTPQNPLEGEIVEVKQLTHTGSLSETYHVVINHYGKFDYLEGQNVGIIPPGRTGISFVKYKSNSPLQALIKELGNPTSLDYTPCRQPGLVKITM
jgi:sulfite reductase alpha subunit-like flavoprotein